MGGLCRRRLRLLSVKVMRPCQRCSPAASGEEVGSDVHVDQPNDVVTEGNNVVRCAGFVASVPRASSEIRRCG